MPARSAEAEWKGNLPEGSGTMAFGSGAFEGQYSFASRFEEGEGTNPEELIAAAHAGCYSMFLANVLSEAGHEPDSVQTTAKISLDKGDDGFSITRSDLATKVSVAGLEDAAFQEHAATAKEGCPVSRALGAIEISIDAQMS